MIQTLYQKTREHKFSILLGTYALATLTTFILSGEAFAAKTIEDQLTAVHTLATGKFIKTGMTIATIGGVLTSIIKGSPGLALIIGGIGVGLSLYMGWLNTYDWSQ